MLKNRTCRSQARWQGAYSIWLVRRSGRRADLISICNCIKESNKDHRAELFSVWQMVKQWAKATRVRHWSCDWKHVILHVWSHTWVRHKSCKASILKSFKGRINKPWLTWNTSHNLPSSKRLDWMDPRSPFQPLLQSWKSNTPFCSSDSEQDWVTGSSFFCLSPFLPPSLPLCL